MLNFWCCRMDDSFIQKILYFVNTWHACMLIFVASAANFSFPQWDFVSLKFKIPLPYADNEVWRAKYLFCYDCEWQRWPWTLGLGTKIISARPTAAVTCIWYQGVLSISESGCETLSHVETAYPGLTSPEDSFGNSWDFTFCCVHLEILVGINILGGHLCSSFRLFLHSLPFTVRFWPFQETLEQYVVEVVIFLPFLFKGF